MNENNAKENNFAGTSNMQTTHALLPVRPNSSRDLTVSTRPLTASLDGTVVPLAVPRSGPRLDRPQPDPERLAGTELAEDQAKWVRDNGVAEDEMRRSSTVLIGPCLILVVVALDLASCSNSSTAAQPEAQLTINELLVVNALTSKDETGSALPWLELHNPTDRDVPLDGYAVTDDPAIPRKAILSGHLLVPAQGFLVLWCDERTGVGPAHVGIQLTPSGGVVAIVRPDGSVMQELTYGPQAVDLSAAREPDGSSN